MSNRITNKINSEAETQLEMLLSGEACVLYQAITGHTPNLTDCRFLSPRELAFIFENVVTPIEYAFLDQGLQSLTQKIRQNIDEIFHCRLKGIVHQYTHQPVIDTLSKSKLETNRKGIIFILDCEHSMKSDLQTASVFSPQAKDC